MRAMMHTLEGLKAVVRLRRMVFLLGAVNLALALVLAVPLLNLLQDSLGSSQAGQRLASGFDYLWWEEFRDSHSGLADTFSPDIIGRGALLTNIEGLLYLRFLRWPPAVLALLLFYILVHTFLAGGIVSSLTRPAAPFRLADFFDGAGRYFFRFLGLTLMSWVLFFGLGLPLHRLLEGFLEHFSSGAMTEVGPFLLNLGLRSGFLVFFIAILTVFDYARVITVERERKNILAALGRASRFVLRHPLSVAALAGLFLVAAGLVSTAYVLVKEAIPLSPGYAVPLSFLWQQLFILSLIALRGGSYAAQLNLIRFHGHSRYGF